MDQLDDLTQKKLDEILRREVLALDNSDIAFLKARVSYLNPVQKEFYAEVLNKEFTPKKEPNLNKSRSYKALQSEVAKLGHSVVGVKREELERMLETATGPH